LENARKYNRLNGRIHVSAREDDNSVILTIGNTGSVIPPEAQDHISNVFIGAPLVKMWLATD